MFVGTTGLTSFYSVIQQRGGQIQIKPCSLRSLCVLHQFAFESKLSMRINAKPQLNAEVLFVICRDDWIRTSDHTPPRRVRYRAALRPDQGSAKVKPKGVFSKKLQKHRSSEIFFFQHQDILDQLLHLQL